MFGRKHHDKQREQQPRAEHGAAEAAQVQAEAALTESRDRRDEARALYQRLANETEHDEFAKAWLDVITGER